MEENPLPLQTFRKIILFHGDLSIMTSNSPSTPYDDFTSEQINAITEGLVEHYMNETSMAWRHEAYAKAAEFLSDYMICRQMELTLPFDEDKTMKVEIGVRPFYINDVFNIHKRLFGGDEDFPEPEGFEKYIHLMTQEPVHASFVASPVDVASPAPILPITPPRITCFIKWSVSITC